MPNQTILLRIKGESKAVEDYWEHRYVSQPTSNNKVF